MAQYEIKKCDITIECGATFTMYFVVRDNNNSLVDLTGSTVEAQLREYAEANDYFEFTATHNGSGGRVTLTMPFEDTAAIPYTSGVYDVYITDQNNDREKYLIGDVNIVPAVTKPVAGEIIYLLSFASEDDFPSYGMVRRLYFSHATNHMYRWNGTDYVDIVTDGEAATVEVGDVETLPAGSDATVENVGSLLNAVFDFGIPEGNGIASIEKTGTDVLTDTYTITFTDPSAEAFDFDVTNGKGIVSIAEVVSGLTHTFTATFNDGDTFTYTLTDGNGIVSIEKTGATDNVDHYRITFDDGTYFDYNVTNVDTSEFYDKDEVDALLADKADVGDSYTKDEEDALLADKADSADLGDLASKDTVDWDTDIDDIPETFPPSAHNHDDRYYTETETDALLSAKADSSDVYTKTSVDTALALKANSADVYTKTATDALLLDKAPVILNSASGSIASFSDGSASPVTALSVSIEPVQSGTGDPSPENVRPISGHSTATVTRTGKNLLNIPRDLRTSADHGFTYTLNSDGSVRLQKTANSNTWAYVTYKALYKLSSGTYTFSISDTLPYKLTIYYFDPDGTDHATSIASGNKSVTFTTSHEIEHIRIQTANVPANTAYDNTVFIQLEKNSVATEIIPYQGTSVTIDLDGTIYGGTMNVLTGTMTVDRSLFTYTGSEQWNMNGGESVGYRQFVITQGSLANSYTAKTNLFQMIELSDRTQKTGMVRYGDNIVRISFTIADSESMGITSIDSWKAFLASNNLQIWHLLKTPLTITLTPSQMQTLLGQNNIWADTGDTSVTYRADSKMYIDQQIAESQRATRSLIAGIETAMVASKNYAEGDLLIVGDALYKTTATIASGATLTVGINVAVTTVAEQLIALANA